MGYITIEALIAPLGMKRNMANKLFYDSKYVEDIPMIDLITKIPLIKNGEEIYFPKGF